MRIVAEDVDQRTGVDRIDMLGVEWEPCAGEMIGDAGIDRLQPRDRGEQAERAAPRRLDQPRIGMGKLGQIAALEIGDDQHLRRARIVERAFGGEALDRGIEVARAGARLGPRPAGILADRSAGQRRGGDEHAMRRRQHGRGQRSAGIKPVAMQADVELAPLDAIDRQPVDEIGIGLAS